MSSLLFLSLCRVKKNSVDVHIEYQEKESEYYLQDEGKDVGKGEEIVLSQPLKDISFSSSFEISCSLDPFEDFVLSGFLPIFLGFLFRLGIFEIFREHIQIPMKEVTYSNIQKIGTLISSIAVGCEDIDDINDRLLPYPSLAGLLEMERFPDQSQISRFLRRIGVEEIQDISLVYELLLKEYGLCMRKEKVDLNIDSMVFILLTFGPGVSLG